MNRNFLMCWCLVWPVVLAPLSARSQGGDRSIDPPSEVTDEPSPVLSPEASMKTFEVEAGFVVELVAAEPLIEDPVCMAWDEDGRLWVAEMRGYMPDRFGDGEDEPTGRIVVLTDTDGDGVMDARDLFLDGIVLPRALAFVKNGLLYADAEKLYFVKIETDGTAGLQQVIDSTYANDGNAKSNPEHQANGLLYGLDNFYYSARSTRRYKLVDGRLRTDKATPRNPQAGTELRGQWGITQDDDGRILTNSNSTLIEYELLPPSATKRNPNFRFEKPILAISPNVWPAHATPGVNRAYLPSVVDRQTWKLKVATAACGPVIYRGNQFPGAYYLNAFVPEPAGNLVKRVVLGVDEQGKPTAQPAYVGKEFLTTTDERSRFVNAYNGPDGALYLVDMYRGVVQHHTYISQYLLRQIDARKLDTPLGMGRIYRVVHRASPIDHTPPKLSATQSAELVALLGHENAWHRHTAQRLLVQRDDSDAVPALEAVAGGDENPQARIHALWTLRGMNRLTAQTLLAAGTSDSPRVRAQVVRIAEAYENKSEARQFVSMMRRYAEDEPDWALDLQLALSAGVLASIDLPQAYDVLLGVIERRGEDVLFLNAAVSGLRGKEAAMLARVEDGPIEAMLGEALVKATESGDLTIDSLLALVDAPHFEDRRDELLSNLSSQAVEGDRLSVIEELAEKLGSDTYSESNKRAIIEGMIAGGARRVSPMELDGKPEAFVALQTDALQTLADLAASLDDVFVYERDLLDAETIARIQAGRLLYGAHCSNCHGEDGAGRVGSGPPLSPSNWVNGSPKMLATLVLNGVEGPIVVNGKLYEPPAIQAVMNGFKHVPIDDQDIADILTYIRSKAFGNDADPIDPAIVTQARADHAGRDQPMSPRALWAIHLAEGYADAPMPQAQIVRAGWLNHAGRFLVVTLLAVAAPLIVLLVWTLYSAAQPKP